MINKAREFAREKHKDQKRKYTLEPYFVHLEEVANIVREIGGSEEMIAAAYLHDVVEDQPVNLEEIYYLFGGYVAYLVGCLTDTSKPSDGNRRARKDKDLLHTADSNAEAKTIKLADLISNTRSIVEYDPDFARVYLREKERLLEVLQEGNSILFNQARDMLLQSILGLKQRGLWN
jgi:(p)ppGpp synthase/HD superfamily hydrolase